MNNTTFTCSAMLRFSHPNVHNLNRHVHLSAQGIPGWNKEQLVNEMFEAMATVDGDDDSVISDDEMPGLIAIDKDEPSPELIQNVRKVPVTHMTHHH